MLTVTCPQCRKPSRIRPEAIGQKIRCPHCSLVMLVPARASAPFADAPLSGKLTAIEPQDQSVELGKLDDDDAEDADPDDILGRPMRSAAKPKIELSPSSLTTSRLPARPSRSGSSMGNSVGSSRTAISLKAVSATDKQPLAATDAPAIADWKRGDSALRYLNVAVVCFFLPLLAIVVEVIANIVLPLRDRQTPGFLGEGRTLDRDLFASICAISLGVGGVLLLLSRVRMLRLAGCADARALGWICLLTTVTMLAGLGAVGYAAESTDPGTLATIGTIVGVGSLILSEMSFHLLMVQVGYALRVRSIGRDAMVLPLLLVGMATAMGVIRVSTTWLTPPPPMSMDLNYGYDSAFIRRDEFALLIVGIQLIAGVLVVFRYRAIVGRIRQRLTA